MAIVTAFGQRLSSRMSQVGTNGALAAQRRHQWSRKGQGAKLEREATWLNRVQGHSIVIRGRFWRGAGRLMNIITKRREKTKQKPSFLS